MIETCSKPEWSNIKCKKRLADYNAGKTGLLSCDHSNNHGAVDEKIDGS